jgi:hypothetical protein
MYLSCLGLLGNFTRETTILSQNICPVVHNAAGLTTNELLFHREYPENIVPPIPEDPCDGAVNDLQRLECEGKLKRSTIIGISVAAGFIIVAIVALVALTCMKWIQAVRPAREKQLVRYTADRNHLAVIEGDRYTRRGRHVPRMMCGREEPVDEESATGIGTETIAPSVEEDGVWYSGVKMLIPWGKGKKGRQPVRPLSVQTTLAH